MAVGSVSIYHCNMPPKRRSIQERIKGKYTQKGRDECWPWTAAKTSAGYGHLLADGEEGEPRVTVLAHRAIYEMFIGPIPEDYVLDHTCHTEDKSCPGNSGCIHRGCVNPYHLEPVTFGENCLRGRGISAINQAKTHCNSGHEFTPETVTYDKKGARECKICKRIRHKEWGARNPDYVIPSKRKAA